MRSCEPIYISKIKITGVAKLCWVVPHLSDFHAAAYVNLVKLFYLNNLLGDKSGLLILFGGHSQNYLISIKSMPFFGSPSENWGSSHLRIKTQIAITEVDLRLNQT